MKPLKELDSELAALQAEASRIRKAGAIVNPSFWLDSTSNGRTQKTYFRKRWFDSDGNKHSETLSKEAYSQLQKQLAAGRELARLKKRIQKVTGEIDRARQLLRSLGVSA